VFIVPPSSGGQSRSIPLSRRSWLGFQGGAGFGYGKASPTPFAASLRLAYLAAIKPILTLGIAGYVQQFVDHRPQPLASRSRSAVRALYSSSDNETAAKTFTSISLIVVVLLGARATALCALTDLLVLSVTKYSGYDSSTPGMSRSDCAFDGGYPLASARAAY
jgi:hypothetical protein